MVCQRRVDACFKVSANCEYCRVTRIPLPLATMTSASFPIAQQLGNILKQQRLTVTVAESCTGGGVAHAITSVPGSSSWFGAGFVTYSNESKIRELGVHQETLQHHGAVSEVVVEEMAAGALRKAHADVAVAISGVAGPDGGSAEKPVGTVWFAWATKRGLKNTQVCHFDGDRARVREQAVIKGLQGLVEILRTDIE